MQQDDGAPSPLCSPDGDRRLSPVQPRMAQVAEETRREIFFYAREGEDTRGCVGRAAEQRRQTAGDGEAPRDDGRGDASEGRGEDARRRRGGAASGATGLGLGSPEPAP